MGAGNFFGVVERVAEREKLFRDAEGSLSLFPFARFKWHLCRFSLRLD